MRAGTRSMVVLVGVAVLGLPAVGQAQAPTVSRGLLRGSLPAGATGGLLQGPLNGGETSGLLRGSVPPGATVGVVTGGAPPPGGTVGGFRGSLPPGERAGALLGDVPVGTPVFALPTPAPSGARLGDPRPADIAGRVQDQGRQFLIEGDYGDGEARLRSSVSIHEKASGAESPPVVESLEQNAGVLRIWNRGAAATEMEVQATAIRKRQELSVSPTPAAPPSPLELPATSLPTIP
jgi:hypothetical protein